jgi:hypothetical protein
VGVSLTEYAIENHALPMVNPLDSNTFFANPLVVFYTLTALILGILGINPLIGWAVLALLNGLLICILIYLISRRYGASVFASNVAMLSVPLITNGTNAPGIWFFVPFLGSLTIFLFAILLTLNKKTWPALGMYIFSLILYPPMVLFIIPSLIGLILYNRSELNKSKNILYASMGGTIIGSGFVSLFFVHSYGWTGTLKLLTSWIIRQNLDGGIPSLSIWNIIPIPLLILACVGIGIVIKKRMYAILLPIFVGIVMWIIYAYVPQTFIIDYSRIVSITAIFFITFVGLGMDMLITYASKWHIYVGMSLKIVILICFIGIACNYPSQNNWSKLTLAFETGAGTQTVYPSNPINRYLDPSDLSLFTHIDEQYFLSPPWKGLVIGVATHNYPLESKSSTISNELMSYDDFFSVDCVTKNNMASSSKLAFVYTKPFNCPSFKKIGDGSEYLSLYQYERQ